MKKSAKKHSPKLSIDERIYALEKLFPTPGGTQLSRTLDWDKGTMWGIGFGQMMTPKKFYSGATIEEAIANAEKALLDDPQNFRSVLTIEQVLADAEKEQL